MTFVGAALVIVAAFAVARYALWRARNATNRAHRREKLAENFYKAAGSLASVDEMPPEMLSILSSLNETITDPNGPKILLQWMFRGHRIEPTPDVARIRKIADEFFESRPELQQLWWSALSYWFLTVSYHSWWRGPILRASVNERELVSAAKRVGNNHRPSDDGAGLHHHPQPA